MDPAAGAHGAAEPDSAIEASSTAQPGSVTQPVSVTQPGSATQPHGISGTGSEALAQEPAVLWDMDGTIVDTEPYFTDAVQTLVTAAGGSLSAQDHHDLVGANLWTLAAIAARAGVRSDADTIVNTVNQAVQQRLQQHVPWRPGARELLLDLRALGVRTALVTMSFRQVAHAVVASAGFDAFDVVVTGDEVARGKPDPEAHLLAATRLGVPISRCLVIEDSPPGVAAGVASGATVLAVPSQVPLPEDPRWTRWESLAGRCGRDLLKLIPPPAHPFAPHELAQARELDTNLI
ncbi:HAD family hydrolase [Kineococcus radiotolerans]|nr:HAD family phosphatase [Kineococcus radiotolerans]